MVEMVAHCRLDEARRLKAGEAILGLALEMRVADEYRQHQFDAIEHVVGRDVLCLLLSDQLSESADALRQRGAKTSFMRAAIRCGNGVAIIAFGAALAPQRP